VFLMFKRVLRFSIIASAGAYVAIVGFVKVRESALLYQPLSRVVDPPNPKWRLNERAVRYASTDSTPLTGWIIPAAPKDSSGMWILICHGQSGNIGDPRRAEFYAYTRDIGLNVLAFDYRGFGASGGAPSEPGLYEDAEASYRYLRNSLHVPAARILIFGHSLGSGVAIELATRVAAAGLIVEGAYTSVPDRGQETYPLLPIRLIASNRFASIDKVGRITMPKLFLHSPTDDIIPFHHGRSLFVAAAEPKEFVEVKGGHVNAYRDDRATYFGAVARFAARVFDRAVTGVATQKAARP
jgi:fermentation-respiration switch protein FrsA (DUF1100 family)